MAGTNNLVVIDQLLNRISLNAEKTGTLFAELSRIIGSINSAALQGNVEALKAANVELERYQRGIFQLAQKQYAANQPIVNTLVTGPPKGGLNVPDENAQALTARQEELQKAFGTGAAGVAKMQTALKGYNIDLDKLSKVYIDPISNTRQFTFETRNAQGIIERATIGVDRFGNILSDSGTRFRGFADMISRNVAKVLEWAVAVGVVYGAFAKLGEASKLLVDFNESMSNIALTTDKSGAELNQFFEKSADAAKATGTSLENVLNIYDDAIRATHGISNETERYAAANRLVTSALTFSRLAGISQAEAMDHLVAAASQVTGSVSNTTEMLDLWVYAARHAKVSMTDMAETFSITGAAAGEAGISMYKLAAVATVMGEKTSKSATEVGNTVRRLIGTMTDQSGMTALKKYGIAVEDIAGQARSWDDIMGEISKKYSAGIIRPEAMQQLAYAIGGGPRGSADFIALVKNWQDVNNLADEFKTKSSGSAQEALAIKSQTLTTALNKLSVAFGELVQTLGTKGGLIDSATTLLKLITGLVEGVGSIAEALGPATTRIIALGAAMAVLTKYGPYLKEMMTNKTMAGIGTGAVGINGPTPSWVGGASQPSLISQAASRFATPQFAMAGLYAATNLMGEGSAEDKAIKFGSTIAGAVIGTLTPAGPIIGAAIGDAAGNVILNMVKESRLAAKPISMLSEADVTAEIDRLQGAITTQISPGGLLDVWFGDEATQKKKFEDLASLAKEIGAKAAVEQLQKGPESQGFFGLKIADPKALEDELNRYNAVMAKANEMGVSTPEVQASQKQALDKRNADIKTANDAVLSETDVFVKMQQDKLKKMIVGDVTRKEYKDFAAGIEDAYNRAGMVAIALGENTSSATKQVAVNFSQMSQEVRDDVVDLSLQISTLEDALASTTDPEKAEEYRKRIAAAREELKAVYDMAKNQIVKIDFKFAGFTDFSDYTKKEVDAMIEEAKKMQDAYFEFLGIPPEAYQPGIDEMVMQTKEGFDKQKEVYSQFLDAVKKTYDEAKKESDKFNFERLKDVKPEQFGELQKRSQYWENYLNMIPGYKGKKETFNLSLGEDNTFKSLITTQEALKFAIEDLTDVEKKQLEGQWNIPTGATIMVPLQSLNLLNKGGPGGELGLPPTGLTGGAEAGTALTAPANKLDMAGDKLLAAGAALSSNDWVKNFGTVVEKEKKYNSQEPWVDQFGSVVKQQQQLNKPLTGMGGVHVAEQIAKVEIANPQAIKIDVPSISATFTINNVINLDGETVARNTNRQQSNFFGRASRARGMAGGGVLQ